MRTSVLAIVCTLMMSDPVLGHLIPFAFWRSPTASSVTSGWTWVFGSSQQNQSSQGAFAGVASTAARPGMRQNAVAWTDNSGNFWFFGGLGYDNGDPWMGGLGDVNDMWKFEPATGKWTYIGGYPYISQGGNYGTLGVPSTANFPGSRAGAIGWTDNAGYLWLFGGYGGDELGHGYGYLNDLWRFNPTTLEWTWMSGDKYYGANGNYGTQGVASSTNVPGARDMLSVHGAVDASGNLWLFGGEGNDSAGNFGKLADLWKYDTTSNQWTWMSGPNTEGVTPTFGAKGASSTSYNPGGRVDGVTWIDNNGFFWVTGGHGIDSTGNVSYLNDMWKYELTTGKWTWVAGSNTSDGLATFGTKGTAAAGNTPSARSQAVGVKDSSGNLWMFGGIGYDIGSNVGLLNDLWKFDPTTGQWTWISGAQSGEKGDATSGTYGTMGVPSTSNLISTRTQPALWYEPSSGKLWFFGGWGWLDKNNSNESYLADIWNFKPSTLEWTWYSGPSTPDADPVLGTLGTAAATNSPGGRSGGTTFTDSSGNLWLFGGIAVTDQGGLDAFGDLWKYNTTSGQWTAVIATGFPVTQGVFGSKGASSTSYHPGGRAYAAAWADASGFIWIFGGLGFDSNGDFAELGDLWKYELATGKWTWVTGSKTVRSKGTYGTKGTPSSTTTPGARNSATYWKDASGNFWIFGGGGWDSASTPNYGHLNDLWKFDGSQWTWVSGGKTIAASTATYGTKGTPTASTVPGGRESAVGGVDASGNVWIWGGEGRDSADTDDYLNDLWKWNGSQWTWVAGPKIVSSSAVYGTLGTGATGNIPGARWGQTGGVDSAGNVWVFGGLGFDANASVGVLNDLWKYNPTAGMWTWMSGSNVVEQQGTCNTKNVLSAGTTPGTRWRHQMWMDGSNNLWLYGGGGYDCGNAMGYLYDMWKYKP